MVILSVDLGFLREGRYKVGEFTLAAVYDTSSSEGSVDGPPKEHPKFLSPWIIDAVEVAVALRGIGWDFGKGVYVPKDPRPLNDRHAFLKATALQFIWTSLKLDFFDMLQKLVPGVGSVEGGSIFFTNLPLVPRYLLSTIITACTGALMITGFENLYAGVTLIGVGLLGQPPVAWPPLIDNPWAADSLSDLWSRRWHQALRRTFLVLGGVPGGWVAGRMGTILGAFIASGLIHEYGMALMGRGIDHRVIIFFGLQGILIILERLFKIITGRRVGGTWGRIWAYVNMLTWAQICGEPPVHSYRAAELTLDLSTVNSWYLRGLGGTVVVPPGMSLSRLILHPVLRMFVPSLVG